MKLDLGVSTKTFEGLLKEFKKLEIPDFQRPYEWRSDHWSELLNKQCGNKPFDEKQKTYYSKSDITITKELLKNTTWTAADVDKRQTVLYNHACKIWGI